MTRIREEEVTDSCRSLNLLAIDNDDFDDCVTNYSFV